MVVNPTTPLYHDTCPTCKQSPRASSPLSKEYMDAVINASEKVVKDSHSNSFNADLFSVTARELTNAVQKEYKNLVVDWNTPDTQMLHRLTRDVWQFSAAKNYQQMRDLTLLLKDDQGNVREYSDFKEKALIVVDRYNDTWFRTEYDLAIASSQNAARWVDFQKEKEDVPFLVYQTVGDSSVRAEHRVLDGIIKHIDDIFWNTHYPPLGYGCRCEAIQTMDENPTPESLTPQVSIPKMFQTNLAKEGLIFPKGSAYYVDIPRHILMDSLKYIPAENAYVVESFKGKKILTHINHGVHEVAKNIEIAKNLLQNYPKIDKIELLPDLNIKELELKKRFYPKRWQEKLGAKNPDALIQIAGKDHIVEFKYIVGNGGTLTKHLNEASQKSEYAVISLSPENQLEDWWIKKRMDSWFLSHPNNDFKGVLILDHTGKEIYKKSDLL